MDLSIAAVSAILTVPILGQRAVFAATAGRDPSEARWTASPEPSWPSGRIQAPHPQRGTMTVSRVAVSAAPQMARSHTTTRFMRPHAGRFGLLPRRTTSASRLCARPAFCRMRACGYRSVPTSCAAGTTSRPTSSAPRPKRTSTARSGCADGSTGSSSWRFPASFRQIANANPTPVSPVCGDSSAYRA
jgi:hypothetical protein